MLLGRLFARPVVNRCILLFYAPIAYVIDSGRLFKDDSSVMNERDKDKEANEIVMSPQVVSKYLGGTYRVSRVVMAKHFGLFKFVIRWLVLENGRN